MKKYLSLVMIGLSLMLSGCSKDDNNDPDTPYLTNFVHAYSFIGHISVFFIYLTDKVAFWHE